MSDVFLSVVVANYNYGRFLKDAIDSVLAQSCQDFELIIVDGASTDDSTAIIEGYATKLNGIRFCEKEPMVGDDLIGGGKRARFLWCSEKDRGQSHAFNKGFFQARGRFLTWLNADDVMFPGTIQRLLEFATRYPSMEWFVGGCFWLNKGMEVIKCSFPRVFSKRRCLSDDFSVWGPSSFFKKGLLQRVGGVNEDLHYIMDSALWARFFYEGGASYCSLRWYTWGLRLHEDAKMSRHFFEQGRLKDIQEKKWETLKHESKLFLEYCSNRHGKQKTYKGLMWMSKIRWVVLRNLFDTLRYKGKFYMSYYS